MLKILTIEDLETDQAYIQACLRQFDVKLFKAYNGRDGYSLACEERPHLIFLDVVMPECGGFEVLTNLKNNPDTATALVVLMTADQSEQNHSKALKMGAWKFLEKPINPYALHAILEEANGEFTEEPAA